MEASFARVGAALVAAACAVPLACAGQEAIGGADRAWVDGFKVGHHTLDGRPTGCTVVLAEQGAVGGVDVRGGAPGTREIALLDPVNTVNVVHAVVLSGGSAFGLDAATGVVRHLEGRRIGYPVGPNVVPIVTGAILFDLGLGEDASIRPGPECGERAAASAEGAQPPSGSIGAGAGATVGKLRGMARATKGGIGQASLRFENGLTIAAVVAVNAVGDIVDPSTGQVIAGVRTEDGNGFVDARVLLREGATAGSDERTLQNTTIGAVLTNAQLTKAEATKVAQMAQDGFARTIYPAHTPSDGDALFTLASGVFEGEVSVSTLGALAAEVVAEAVLDAVRSAEGRGGVPALSELNPGR